MIRPKSRRDFLFDSGAITFFARRDPNAVSLLESFYERFDEPSFLIPYENFVEAITGDPRRDANVNRLLNKLDPYGDRSSLVIYASPIVGTRAAALRTRAITSGAATPKRPISVADATLVALAEERSARNAVTILTSDPHDIRVLVELVGAPNIAIHVV